MSQGVVKSSPEALEAIRQMQNTINGGLMDAITTLMRYGDSLNLENFAGTKADEFYSEWPTTKTALTNAKTALEGMSNDIMSVNTNIQVAGGNQ
jgi:Proteins of 100 residues with WXG